MASRKLTPEQAVLPLVDFGTLARTNRGLFKKNQEPAASRCQKLIVFDLFTFFTKVRYSIRQRRNFIKSAFEEDGPKKFDEFECAKNRRSSNVVEFECELRHIPTIWRRWRTWISHCMSAMTSSILFQAFATSAYYWIMNSQWNRTSARRPVYVTFTFVAWKLCDASWACGRLPVWSLLLLSVGWTPAIRC